MFLFIALMIVLGSLLQNSHVEVHGGGGGSSLNAPGRLIEGVHNVSLENAKEFVNKTEMEIRGRR